MSIAGERLIVQAVFACTRAIVNAIQEAHSANGGEHYWFNIIRNDLDKAEESVLK